jgi:polysaccharide export outer membrane protein
VLKSLRRAGFAAVLLLAACASRGPVATTSGVLPVADPVTAAIGRPEYRIGPSDLLSVTVFQTKDLDREVRVDNAGQVSLPLIGAVEAAGRTAHELEADLATRYGARYLQDPQISVFVKEFASQRVTVDGAVGKPGIYPLTTRLSLLQAISLAEGLDDNASEHNVFVFRTVKGKRQFARFDLEAIRNGSNDDPEIQGEDVIVVDTSTGKVFLQNLIKVVPIVGIWRIFQ